MRIRRIEVARTGFAEKRIDQQQRTARQRRRACMLRAPLPLPCARLVIQPQRQMNQARQQDENMPRAIQQPDADLCAFEMVVELVHVLPRQQKRDEHQEAKDEVKAFHGKCLTNNRCAYYIRMESVWTVRGKLIKVFLKLLSFFLCR